MSEGVLTRERVEGGRGRCACIKAPPACTNAPSCSSGRRHVCLTHRWMSLERVLRAVDRTGCCVARVRLSRTKGGATRGGRAREGACEAYQEESPPRCRCCCFRLAWTRRSLANALREGGRRGGGEQRAPCDRRHESAREPPKRTIEFLVELRGTGCRYTVFGEFLTGYSLSATFLRGAFLKPESRLSTTATLLPPLCLADKPDKENADPTCVSILHTRVLPTEKKVRSVCPVCPRRRGERA